jgi:hypothetical protein
MAGHDMNDWCIGMWFDLDVNENRGRRRYGRKPDQDIYIVGPSGPKGETRTFGLALVDFLCRAGAPMVRGKDDYTFVRTTSGHGA